MPRPDGPPLAYGGHCFEHAAPMGGPTPPARRVWDDKRKRPRWVETTPGTAAWWRCVHCLAVVPSWVLAEGFWRALAGPWCQGRLRALNAAAPRPPGDRGTTPTDDFHGAPPPGGHRGS